MKLTTIATTIAVAAHAINRAYCESLGDDSQPAWDDASEAQRASIIAGVEMHLANPDATPEQSHQSWLERKLAEGWVYGEVKNDELKQHPCCLPYDELPPAQKSKDYIFRAAVHALKDAAALAVATPASAAVVPAASPGQDTIAVRYIGRRPEWTDRLYRSGLTFVTDQVRALPWTLARKLLTHGDLFERYSASTDAEQDEGSEQSVASDTEALLEQAAKTAKDEEAQRTDLQDLYDRVNQMDKKGLEDFAKINFRIDLNSRDTKASMQQQVIGLIDQYGVP